MPTYYARNTAVQLSVADLARTTTIRPQIHQGISTYERISANVAHFIIGSKDATLDETPLEDDGVSSGLRFLGAHKDMPFLMVRAGKFYFDVNTDERRTRRPIRLPMIQEYGVDRGLPPQASGGKPTVDGVMKDYAESQDPENNQSTIIEHRWTACAPPLMIPHALCLTVFLSSASFIRSYKKNAKGFNDVKIDVFFNGQLCGSTYVPERNRADAHNLTDHIIRFSGCKLGKVLEKPWMIVPPDQTPNEDFQRTYPGREVSSDAKRRWASISKALATEAVKLKKDSNGKLTVLGNYLLSLAELEMPSEVNEMQRAGGLEFGVVDVVITTGKGHKDESGNPYLMKPTPIRPNRPVSEIRDGLKDVSTNFDELTLDQSQIRSFPRSQSGLSEKRNRVTQQPNFTIGSRDLVQSPLNSMPRSDRQEMALLGMKTKSLGEFKQSSKGDTKIGEPLSTRGFLYPTDGLQPLPQGAKADVPKNPSKDAWLRDSPFPGYGNVDPIRQIRSHGVRYSPGTIPLSADSNGNNRRRCAKILSRFSMSNPRPVPTGFSNVHEAHLHKTLEELSVGSSSKFTAGRKRSNGSNSKHEKPKPKRARLHYEIVHDNKMTLAEEIASITTEACKPQAANGSDNNPRLTRQSLATIEANAQSSANEGNSTEETRDMGEGIGKEKKKPIKLKLLNPKQPSPTISNPNTPQNDETTNPFPFTPQYRSSATSYGIPYTPAPSLPTPCPTRLPQTQPPTSLSDNSVLTYAPDGIFRQVKGERGGWFEEEAVLVGFRFLVG